MFEIKNVLTLEFMCVKVSVKGGINKVSEQNSFLLNKQHVFNERESYNVAVIGDCHLNHRTPRSRKDNYYLNTVAEIDQIFKANDILLFLGDVFDTPILEGKSLYKFINLLKFYTKLGKKIYTIVGNHDIYTYNIDTLSRTSLGLMFVVGLIKNHKRIKVHDVLFDGMPFNSKAVCVPRMEYKKPTVLLGHYFYNFNLDLNYSLTDDMIKEMNYDYLLLGHDHKPYPEQKIGKTTLLRGGSIARDSADSFNLTRKPCYYQFVIDKSGIKELNYVEVPNSLVGKEIFIDDVFENQKQIDNEYTSVTTVDDILKQFTKRTAVAKYTITNALNDLKSPEEVVSYIKTQYQLNNVPFI